MNGFKIALFFVGLVLIRYVGGMPEDTNNFFITQFVFFAPFLVDFYKLVKVEKKIIQLLALIGFIAGLIVLLLNFFGILGIVQVEMHDDSFNLIFNSAYAMGITRIMELSNFMNIGAVAYMYIFTMSIVFDHRTSRKNDNGGVVPDVSTG